MQTHCRVAHVTLNLLLRCQGSHRVDDDDVDSSRADQLFCNLQCLLTIVWLRDIEVIDIHTQLLCIETVEGMLCIDKGCNTASLLCLGNGVDGQRGLTTRLRTIYLDDTSLGIASHAQCSVQTYRAGGDHLYILDFLFAHTHDRALAEVFLNLRHGGLQGL